MEDAEVTCHFTSFILFNIFVSFVLQSRIFSTKASQSRIGIPDASTIVMAANKTRSFMRCLQHFFFYISIGHSFPHQNYTSCIVGVRKFPNYFCSDFIATTLILKCFERFTPVSKDRLWWQQVIGGFPVKTVSWLVLCGMSSSV
jgi:hypothetical protein